MLAAVGRDQSGIVSAVSQVFFDTQCNVEDTSMTLLEDHFSMMFIIQAPPSLTVDKLQEKLTTAFPQDSLHFSIYTIETQQEEPQRTGTPWMISVSGPDQTGIMFHVTRYLAQHQINIQHLSSKRLTRSNSMPLFLMALEVDVPASISEHDIIEDLKALAQKQQLEIHAEPLEVYTL